MLDALRRALRRRVFGPYLIQRLHLEPGDALILRMPRHAIDPRLLAALVQMLGGKHWVIVLDEQSSLSTVGREQLLAAAEYAKPSPMPYGMTI